MTSTAANQHFIADSVAFAARFGVSRETRERLEVYATLLTTWQRTINLVAPGTLAELWHRHLADSAQIVAEAPKSAATWVDLGSGAGFPGLVVALMRAGQTRVTLIESDTRKAAFLAEVARKTAVAVEIWPVRIEQAASRSKVPFDVISARALAPLPKLIQLASPLAGPETTMLFLKGRGYQSEIEALMTSQPPEKPGFLIEAAPSFTDAEGRILKIRAASPPEGPTP